MDYTDFCPLPLLFLLFLSRRLLFSLAALVSLAGNGACGFVLNASAALKLCSSRPLCEDVSTYSKFRIDAESLTCVFGPRSSSFLALLRIMKFFGMGVVGVGIVI